MGRRQEGKRAPQIPRRCHRRVCPGWLLLEPLSPRARQWLLLNPKALSSSLTSLSPSLTSSSHHTLLMPHSHLEDQRDVFPALVSLGSLLLFVLPPRRDEDLDFDDSQATASPPSSPITASHGDEGAWHLPERGNENSSQVHAHYPLIAPGTRDHGQGHLHRDRGV